MCKAVNTNVRDEMRELIDRVVILTPPSIVFIGRLWHLISVCVWSVPQMNYTLICRTDYLMICQKDRHVKTYSAWCSNSPFHCGPDYYAYEGLLRAKGCEMNISNALNQVRARLTLLLKWDYRSIALKTRHL